MQDGLALLFLICNSSGRHISTPAQGIPRATGGYSNMRKYARQELFFHIKDWLLGKK
jgi:hypothetical protein